MKVLAARIENVALIAKCAGGEVCRGKERTDGALERERRSGRGGMLAARIEVQEV
jgi:hypothetical protein